MLKNKISSNRILNYMLFLTIMNFNLFFYIGDRFKHFYFLFLSINIYLIFLFFWLNLKHDFDFHRSKNNIRKLMGEEYVDNEDTKNILKTKINYKDHKDLFSLFKNSFVKKNLLRKDYSDLKRTFLKFIPEPFVKEIGDSGIDKIWLWISVKKYLSVLFLDIIWFTWMAEKISKEKTLLLLNIYFDWIVEIMKSYWWYVDKFLWDWMMVIFNTQNSDDILNASIDVQNFLNKIQLKWDNKSVRIWIWINSWEVILWTVGSRNRMEITIIWDVVNTASRIEWLTRWSKYNILISEETYNNIKNKENYKIDEIWYKKLKWKKRQIKLYWIIERNPLL